MKITRQQWEAKKRHGYASIASGKWGIPKGTPCILKWGDGVGTTLVAVEIVEEKPQPAREQVQQ